MFILLCHVIGLGQVGATFTVNALPLLDGAAALAAEGILSTLQTSNLSVESLVRAESALRGNAAYPLCFDPQTSGGLLATVPAAEVDACIAQLHKIGCDHATVIGSIKSLDPASAEPLIRLS